jgi:hypothetical protein
MAEGYEVYVDNRDFEVDGITGKVNRYCTSNRKFPFFEIHNDNTPVPIYLLKTVPSLLVNLGNSAGLSNEQLNKSINLYFSEGDTVLELGRVLPRQAKALLAMFEGYEVTCYLDEGKELKGEYMYVLSD